MRGTHRGTPLWSAISRRDFLKTSLPAFAALSGVLAGCGGGGNTDSGPDELGAEGPLFPAMQFLPVTDPNYSDYRPAVDATGNQVIFERTSVGGGPTTLQVVRSLTATSPAAFVLAGVAPAGVVTGPEQTRPDWCWATGQVALNVPAGASGSETQVLLADSDGTPLGNVPESIGYLYPIWTKDGAQLIVYNNSSGSEGQYPNPHTSLVHPAGGIVAGNRNLNGTDANGVPVFGGFAAPHPGDAALIAFAGQPTSRDFATGATPPPDSCEKCVPTASGYDQCYNYVYLNSASAGVYTSRPLEAAANPTTFSAATQGRAPYWSPDGKWLVFESDRQGGYCLFLANVAAGTPPVQVTDPCYEAQHAKFLPSGTKLVCTAVQGAQPGSCRASGACGPRGIAIIDISTYVGAGS
jgi:hypothetical protein